MNKIDQAIIDWANDQLEDGGLPRDATGIRFGHYVSCYSSYTCDYGVTASIQRACGLTSDTSARWCEVLESLPAYVAALTDMENEHDRYHQPHDHDSSEREIFFT